MNPSPAQASKGDSTSALLADVLVRENYLSPEDVKKATQVSDENKISFQEALIQTGVMTRGTLGQAVGEYYRVGFIDLDKLSPQSNLIQKIPEEKARSLHMVLAEERPDLLLIATSDPSQSNLTPVLQQLFPGKKIQIGYAFYEDVEKCMKLYNKSLSTRFAEIISSQNRVAPEIIGQIVNDAISLHASDIHFEPQEKETVVRFRIDGVLHESGRIPREFYENILNRVKVLSHLRIDEHVSSQDGSIRFGVEHGFVDIRISIVPTIDGEKIVMRLLSEYVKGLSFKDLGLSRKNEEILTTASQKPFGMIVVSGPTGSGKTTTLYSILKLLNNPGVNITTIEDPVEYKVQGINQIQVNNATNLTFAQGLRTIVRQDPDIILVGEIRDLETAEIAVNASLTGHLLLTTFHANDAATAIPRLLDMGVEPFLLASTLELIVAQRLVRTLCEVCRYSATFQPNDFGSHGSLLQPFLNGVSTIYKAKGCSSCNNTGYKGRVAIFEMIQVTQELQDLILTHPSTNTVWQLARKNGSRTLFEDGMEKVKLGVTSLEELIRVAKIPVVEKSV
jgi:type II secretory ATPase GspE/PulE/Tfp pilus assembly ATPase PilB-like protein